MTNNKILRQFWLWPLFSRQKKQLPNVTDFIWPGAPGMQSMKLMTTEAESETVFPTISLTRKDLLLPAELVTDTSISEPK